MDKITLIPSAIVINDNIAYMFSQYVNLLYSYDLNKKETRLLSSIPEEEFFTVDLCAKMVLHSDYLVLVPLKAKKIWKYNLKTNEWHGIELKPLAPPDSLKFFQGIVYANKVMMTSCVYPSIVTLDLTSDSLEYHPEVCEYFSDYTEDKAFFRVDYVMKGNNVYLASCKTNVVVKINIDDYKCNFYEVGKKGNSYSGIAYDGKNFWLSPRKSLTIVKWDGIDGVEECNLPNGISSHIVNFLGVCVYKGNILLPGGYTDTLQLINKDFSMLECIAKKYNFFQSDCGEIRSCSLDGDVILEQSDVSVINFRCEISRSDFDEYLLLNSLNIKYPQSNYLYENKNVDLDLFCNYFVK